MQGLDPYDALRGDYVPQWVMSRQRLRQTLIQIRRRLPIDLSGLLGIRPFVMAKAVGAMLSVASRATACSDVVSLLVRLAHTDGRLKEGRWGYEFDVQTRWAFYPAGSPNLIATVFVSRGLGSAGIVMNDENLLHEMTLSADFLQRKLLESGERPYFRYTFTSNRLVHNANLLGAGLVGMDGALRGDGDAVEQARAAAQTTISAQRDDGSWPYGEGGSLGWSDSFHTAYNLDGLLQVWLATGEEGVRSSLERGITHWVRDFFGPDGEPKYYPHRAYPYDIHSAGTAVDVAARLATWGWDTGDLAERVANWTQEHLVNPRTGETYYQKHRLWTDKRHFVRWGDAHWALGASSLVLLRESRRDPLELAVAEASGVLDYEG